MGLESPNHCSRDSSYYPVQGHCSDLEIPGDCLPLAAFLEVEAMMGVAGDVVPD